MLLALVLVAAAAGQEEQLSIGVVDTLTAEARLDNGNGNPGDDDYGNFINRLNLVTNTPTVSISARIDTVLFVDTPTSAYQNDMRVERINVELRLGSTMLIAGDMYKQIGRGIILSLRKVDEVGVDVALRGAEARWSPEGHALSLFSGVINPANLDTVSLFPVRDTGDVLAGATYELSALDGFTFGLNGLYAQPSERLLDTLDYTVSGGATAEAFEVLEGLNFYLEGAIQDRRLAGGNELGTALYLTADYVIGDLTLLLEALRFADFEQKGSRNTALNSRFDYTIPPTLERIDQEVLSTRDVVGSRLRAELAFFDADLITHANLMVRVADPGQPAEVLNLHGYAGAEYRFDERTSKFALAGGYRDESSHGTQVKSMIHGELDLTKSFAREFSLHLVSNNELRTLQERRYGRGSTFAGVEWSGHGSFTLEFGYDTQNPSPEVRSVFFAGILALDLIDALRVRLTAGTERGGLKCVAGICREFPPFAGVRSELVFRL